MRNYAECSDHYRGGIMAGIIKQEVLEKVKERARIEDIIGQIVLLKPAGIGSLKGLCPFHDEKTPSFHVRPAQGYFHCFGCGVGGDAIKFVQDYHHLSFHEAVEFLADKYGIILEYEEQSRSADTRSKGPSRQRIIAANTAAQQFFHQQLQTVEAGLARQFLLDRNFGPEEAKHFGLGYAPDSWDCLLNHLRKQGFTEVELQGSGLFSQGSRGIYDRFRGRLIWPIRDLTGAVIGFGARRLREDDEGPKYLNTPETIVYKKSQVLYGIEMARKEILAKRRVVVVEGYTDVMAAHLAGIESAVATCGTAFGEGHVRIVRRLLGDTAGSGSGLILADGKSVGGEVIFTFDGDEAGQKAALKAFKEDQSFATQTFVAVDQEGRDPCDIYQAEGAAGVRQLINSRIPLFEFVIKTLLKSYDLERSEGRVSALKAIASIVKGIRDRALQGEYLRRLQGWVALPMEDVKNAVKAATTITQMKNMEVKSFQGGADALGRINTTADNSESAAANLVMHIFSSNNPVVKVERKTLQCVLQIPQLLMGLAVDEALAGRFYTKPLKMVAVAIAGVGALDRLRQISTTLIEADIPAAQLEMAANQLWLEEIKDNLDESYHSLLSALVVENIPADEKTALGAYAKETLYSFLKLQANEEITDLRGRLARAAEGSLEQQQIFAQILKLEAKKRSYQL